MYAIPIRILHEKSSLTYEERLQSIAWWEGLIVLINSVELEFNHDEWERIRLIKSAAEKHLERLKKKS